MKRGMILIILLLLLVPTVSATLGVTLNSPSNAATTSTSVTLNCTATDANSDLSTITFYTDVSGAWTTQGSAQSVSGTTASKTVDLSSLSAATFKWNCLAANSTDTKFASSNYTFTVGGNTAPAFSGPIQNITWTEDTNLTNNITLSNYFTDAQSLTYTVSGNSNINVSISSGVVSFYPNADWNGTETIRFTASDGSLTNTSNYIKLTVTRVNDAPRITTNFTNISMTLNTASTLLLNNYFTDPDGDSLNYTTSNATNMNITISGYTVTITPTTGWTGTTSTTFTATDGTLSTTSETIYLTISSGNNAPTIDTYSPDANPTMEVNTTQVFTITYSDTDNDTLTVAWYVGSTAQTSTTGEFAYIPTEAGTFTVKASVSDGTTTTDKSWTVTVGTESLTEVDENQAVDSIIGEQTSSAKCGNGIVENGETCSTCLMDVPCESGYVCEVGQCVEKKSATKTIILFILIIMIISVVAVMIYYFTTAKKVGKKQSTDKPFEFAPVQQAPPADYTDFYKKK